MFESNCAGCHGANGEGSDSGRPLIGVASQEPDRLVHIASVTNGKGNMPAFGDRLTDEEIDNGVSFVRLTFVAPEEDAVLAVTGPSNPWLAAVGLFTIALGAVLVSAPSRRLT